jgi:hypothetical protein
MITCAKNIVFDFFRTVSAAALFALIDIAVTSLCSFIGLLFYNAMIMHYSLWAKLIWAIFSLVGFFGGTKLAIKVVSRFFPDEWARLRTYAPKR